MSLINEALKKAQRQRTDEPTSSPGTPATAVAGETSFRRNPPPSSGATPMVLLGAAGAVLVVLSVVATVFLLNRPTPATGESAPKVAARDVPVMPTPVVVAPEIKLPTILPVEPAAAVVTPPPAPSPAVTPAPAPIVPTETSSTASSTAVVPPPASTPVVAGSTPSAPRVEGGPDPRVSTFVDAIRVAGIRSSGNESRVLMNDKVYRVNDLVERTLGVRLTKVETETLTFADANGVAYVKKF